MSRIKEKIKDLIEVRSYKSLQDFTVEPSKTLSSYHFTDITSELMANWINALVGVQSQDGAAKALAGYRGVGKSHFLATLGAIVSNPELRSRVSDQHVSASSQHLKRRKYPVVFVRRGTQEKLLDELRFGIANSFGLEDSQIPTEKEEIIKFAAEQSGDVPLVLLIDTAFERESRVAREDGALLGEFAEIAKGLGVFIAVALDDDITDADGINSAIAQSYTIDYLDQEHLYQIVNTDIFPKHRQSQGLIQQIYSDLKNTLLSFRWSEQRFTSLYPLHPSILEVAPFIRLYAQDFALLSFASEAGARILGRPANSLIALDEVFDNVENTLRKSTDLEEAFSAYDQISKEVISKLPVMQRLHAKLILKALFILSLDGDGTSAGEIAATMLIYDEREPEQSIKVVEEILTSFATALPEQIWRKDFEESETRFSFKLSKKDNLNSKLDGLISNIPQHVVGSIFRRVAKDKIEDWHLSVEEDSEKADWADVQFIWRGSIRRVRLFWNWDTTNSEIQSQNVGSDSIDLEIYISSTEESNKSFAEKSSNPTAVWKTSPIRSDETDTLKRFFVLLNDQNLREEFQEQVRAAGHTHMVAVEKIWRRIFINDAKLLLNENEFSFAHKTKEKFSLSEMFAEMLNSHFENSFSEHPKFEKTLAMNDVSKLVNDLFSGARVNHENVQELAETFAKPLGLVSKRGISYLLNSIEELFELPLIQKVDALVNQSADGKVSLNAVYNNLKQSPYGVGREVQHLILAALVAQRKIEFVTSKGDRINRRSLDLKILWDDIEGITKPTNVDFDSKKLTKWAKLITNSNEIQSIDQNKDHDLVIAELNKWLENWKSADLVERFSNLPDEILNTKVWRFATNTEKTFGIVANTIESILDDAVSLEEGLLRIADAFSDSDMQFEERAKDLAMLKNFVEGADLRDKIWSYLAVCESTMNEEIEETRQSILNLIDLSSNSPSAKSNAEMKRLWQIFHTKYSDRFAIKHDSIMRSHQLQEKFDEILKSDEWWEFENLSKMPIFQSHYWDETQKILKQFRELDCSFDVREHLKTHPFCACSFNLAKMDEWENLPQNLNSIINVGKQSYRRTLDMLSEILIQVVEIYLQNENSEEFTKAGKELIEMFSKKSEIEFFTVNHLIILNNVLENMTSSPLLEIEVPQENGLQSSAELRAKLNSWLDELPKEPVLLKV